MGKNWFLTGAIFFVGLSLLVSAHWLSNALANKEFVLNNSPGAINQSYSDNKDLLTLSEAADYLKISEERLNRLIVNSKLVDGRGIPYLKIDGDIWFSKKALYDWTEYSAKNNFEY